MSGEGDDEDGAREPALRGPFDLGAMPARSAPPAPAPVRGTLAVPAGRHDALLAVPRAAADGPVPLLVFFHGSGGTPQQSLGLVGEAAEHHGVAVLAPRSSEYTWDVVVGEPGPDVGALRRALAGTLAHLDLVPGALCLGGFSDGASYALTVGLANPGTVEAVTAFSPGFVVDGAPGRRPRCFVSHGTADRVLPIDRTSRVVVPRLRRSGRDVEHREFDGGHEVPVDAVEAAFGWWLSPRRRTGTG
ncbi:alpha/beta hydrolase [Kineococcus auxinigenes]|uniref:alpha/beta hydrolase n=1 Tax=unclassified Kineococcus TaxID=2621656 RepID=UPI003D7C613E